KRLVEVNGLAQLVTDQGVAARKLGVARERIFDTLGVMMAESARGMPRQQLVDLLALGRFFFGRVHGQPRSIPCSFRSSESFFRAQNMRVFTVASGIPTIAATSSTDFSW